MAFDLTNINTWVEENADIFYTRSIFAGKTAQIMQKLTGLKGDTKIPDFELASGGILQDGDSCGFTEQGTLTIKQRQISPKKFKFMTRFCIQELEDYFTRQILPPGSEYDGLTNIEGQILDHMVRIVMKVIETNIWKGVEGGANPDASLNLMDGLDEIIATEIAAGTIPAAQQTSVGQDTANVISAFDGMRKALPIDQFEEVNETGMSQYVLLTDSVSLRNYEEAYRSTFTALPFNTQFRKMFVDGTNIEIIGVPGLHNTGKSLLTKRSNLWLGVDIDGEETDLRVYPDEDFEFVKVKGRFKKGVQIHFPEEVVINNY